MLGTFGIRPGRLWWLMPRLCLHGGAVELSGSRRVKCPQPPVVADDMLTGAAACTAQQQTEEVIPPLGVQRRSARRHHDLGRLMRACATAATPRCWPTESWVTAAPAVRSRGSSAAAGAPFGARTFPARALRRGEKWQGSSTLSSTDRAPAELLEHELIRLTGAIAPPRSSTAEAGRGQITRRAAKAAPQQTNNVPYRSARARPTRRPPRPRSARDRRYASAPAGGLPANCRFTRRRAAWPWAHRVCLNHDPQGQGDCLMDDL